MKNRSTDAVLLDNLRREMEKRHLSHADISHRSGLSVSTIARIAGGGEERESLSLERLDRLARALGVPPADLLREVPATPGAPGPASTFVKPATFVTARQRSLPPGAEALPRQLGQLIEEFFLLPDAERRELLDTASEMASKYRSQFQGTG